LTNKRKKVKAIIVAGGRGRRFGGARPKPFLRLGPQTILEHSIAPFQHLTDVDEIVIVLPASYVSSYSNRLRKKFPKVTSVVSGGQERTHSVIKGLRAAGEATVYIIHDGVRPFVKEQLIKDVLKAALRFGAAIAAVQATDTVKESKASRFVSKTLDREKIYLVQTPQGFRKQVISAGVNFFLKDGTPVTDDSILVERCRRRVKIIESDWTNFKITTRKDFEIARNLQNLLITRKR
jgi:2-C-methyl-D-erythritol 4-phosphate cytidylyltransferase